MRNTRLAGHGLAHEGAAYLADDCAHCRHMLHDEPYTWSDGRVQSRDGHGRCSCGFVTAHTMSRAERKELHAEHKEHEREAEAMDAFVGTEGK